MFRWTDDGRTFGKGPTWGVAQTGQNINVYVNTQKLKQLGFDPSNMPQTFDDFNSMLAQIRAKLPKNEPVIEFGNNEGYGTIHMFGGIQAAYFSAQDERNWIQHVPGSTWDTADNIKALEAYQSWAKNGYFNSDYNALKYDQSAAEFAKGKGVFWMGGDWDASIIKAGLGSNVAVMNIPPGPSGTWAGVGRALGPVAHLVEDEVPRPGGGLAQLHHRLARGAEADVRAAADPVAVRRGAAAGRRSVPGPGDGRVPAGGRR